MTEGQENKKPLHKLLLSGTEIAAGAVGGALGALTAGPAGAAAAAAGSVIISKTFAGLGDEICKRILSPRESARVGAALATSIDCTNQRLEEGAIPRDDSFMNDGTDRPPITEIGEGLLLAAQRAFDEKKVPYIGRLMANLNFRADLSVEAANVLVRLCNRLSFQQLCLLRLAYENQKGTPLKGGKYEDRFKDTSHAAALADLLDLQREGLVSNGPEAVLGMENLNPEKNEPSGFWCTPLRFDGAEEYSRRRYRQVASDI